MPVGPLEGIEINCRRAIRSNTIDTEPSPPLFHAQPIHNFRIVLHLHRHRLPIFDTDQLVYQPWLQVRLFVFPSLRFRKFCKFFVPC